jgi:inner membrane protein
VPTIFTHAAVGAAIAAAGQSRPISGRLCAAAALCAALPDLDVVTFAMNVPYGNLMGHRGLSHSLVAATAIAAVVTVVMRGAGVSWGRAWALLFLATASHGLLDMCTDGGRGVAIFSPWDTTRYFLPWHPIAVSPIGARFFSARGLTVLASEGRWVLGPTAVALAVAMLLRGRAARR